MVEKSSDLENLFIGSIDTGTDKLRVVDINEKLWWSICATVVPFEQEQQGPKKIRINFENANHHFFVRGFGYDEEGKFLLLHLNHNLRSQRNIKCELITFGDCLFDSFIYGDKIMLLDL